MENYLLVYRMDYNAAQKASPEKAEEVTKSWMDWITGISLQNKLVDRGNRLEHTTGKVVRPNQFVTDGPYAEIKESIGGYSIIKAKSYEEAVEIASGCPILHVGGHVEVRLVSQM